MMRHRLLGFAKWVLVPVVAAAAALPLIVGADPVTVEQHHLQHAVLLLGGGLVGLVACGSGAQARHGRYGSIGWLYVALLAPVAIMFEMDPATYAYIEAHESYHALDHVVMEALAALTTYTGQRYLRGLGLVTGASLELMALVAAWGFGIAPALHP